MAYDLNHSGGIDSDVSGGLTTTMAGTLKIDPSPVDVKVTGEAANPVSVSALITGNPASPVGTQITGNPKFPVGAQLSGDKDNPVASTIDILNLPHLTLTEIKDLLKPNLRMHIPNYQQMSFKLLGFELFTWCLSGETEVIAQPYHPNRFEQCNIECPDEDKRDFPAETPIHQVIRDNQKVKK